MDTSPDKPSLSTDLGTKEATCEQHGLYIAKGMRFTSGKGREFWTDCPTCVAGREQAERRADADARAQRERERLDQMLRDSGIPERVKGCTFGSYVATTDAQKAALQAVMDFAESFEDHLKTGASLILAGKPGTGKGHLAAACMSKLMPRYLPVYTTCLDMIRSVRETWRKDSKFTESQVLQELEDAALLVVDEIGVQYGTEGEQTVIFDVLDRRYRQMRPSIFITNQDLAGFKQFIGDRAYDRLKQTARWVTFDWPSHRSQARKETAA